MNKRRLRRNTGLVLLASGFSHISQLWFYGIENHILIAAGIGLCYAMIGLGLLGQSRTSLWLGCLLPPAGAIGSVMRYTGYETDSIIFVHLAINVVVALICLWLVADAYGWPRRSKSEVSK